MGWREYLFLENDELLTQCDWQGVRGSGPGGQKRNKTSSAVRLMHRPTGLSVRAEKSRSQCRNRQAALEQLRFRIAWELRENSEPISLDGLNVRSPADQALFLDILSDQRGVVSRVARVMTTSTAQVSKFITSQPGLLLAVNRIRLQYGLRSIRSN